MVCGKFVLLKLTTQLQLSRADIMYHGQRRPDERPGALRRDHNQRTPSGFSSRRGAAIPQHRMRDYRIAWRTKGS
jgi:hypothetical protein